MNRFRLLIAAVTVVASTVGGVMLSAPVQAGEGNSIGHGIKCYWVPVTSANGSTVYQQVCRKGI